MFGALFFELSKLTVIKREVSAIFSEKLFMDSLLRDISVFQ